MTILDTRRRLDHRIVLLGLNILIVAAWLWLYRGLADYFSVVFVREDFRTNQLVLLGIAALIIWQAHTGRLKLEFRLAPHLYLPALALAFGGSLLYLAIERWLDINTFSAIFFGIATYGLIGLWLTPKSWRQGLLAALLVIGVLPFGEHLQTFVGYPMRIAIAQLVRDGLEASQIASTGIDTILVLENGVTQVDLPCSGIKSLWTGALFFLAATWLERHRFDVRWFAIAVLFVALLFLANVLRVAALVVAGHVLALPILAEMLHVPLGVMGFIGACAAAVLLLRTGSKPDASSDFAVSPAGVLNIPRALVNSTVLLAAIAVMGLAYSQRPTDGLSQPAPGWSFPRDLQVQPLPLKPDELAWLTRDGAESASRYRFRFRGLEGTMILVPSSSWRAHHRPERCFEVYGLSLDESRAQWIASEFTVRAVTLRSPANDARLGGAYWFQTAGQTTDDYATRIWADTAGAPQRWVLVSLLFDGNNDPADVRVVSLYRELNESVARELESTR